MGKRSEFERKPRDFYPTPYEAVVPLIPHLKKYGIFTFYEPCAGNGALIRHLKAYGFTSSGACDIEPDNSLQGSTYIQTLDATQIQCAAAQYITNPPWDRKLLHPVIENLRQQAPTWLLIDADWAHTKQAKPYLTYCELIVSIGRVKWIPDSKHTGKDNCCWYRFVNGPTATLFIGR